MKTTDGYEAKKGEYYYLANGQVVILDDCATTPDGKEVFVVVPFYEGETMDVSGAGGFHQEFFIDYECEGVETLVYQIFKEVPLDLVHVDYKKKLKEIEALSLTIGMLKHDSKELAKENQKTTRAITLAAKELTIAEDKVKAAVEQLEPIYESLSEKRQKLSELEDSIASLDSKGVSTLIGKDELQRLNKRDFLLNCLEGGGVDNWEWYDESLNDYRERYPD